METNDPNRPDNFPTLDFRECPNCKSIRRVANEVLQIQKDKGNMPKNSRAFLFNHQSVIAKDMNWFSAPAILSFYDTCMDCGTVYCIHVEVQQIMQGGKPVPKAGGGFPSS